MVWGENGEGLTHWVN